ncbi:hypothetical protein N0V94_005982 [Neodidymelliopsis sp. IMI 364377]|nr:hypothetical protein N0V94_005982 [Neodidymelliopsis sp. IMI 364377]
MELLTPDRFLMRYPIPYLWSHQPYSNKHSDLVPTHDTHPLVIPPKGQLNRESPDFNIYSIASYNKDDNGPRAAIPDDIIACARDIYRMNPTFDEELARASAADELDKMRFLRLDWYRLSSEQSIAVLARAILLSSDAILRVLPVRVEYPFNRNTLDRGPLMYFGLVITFLGDGTTQTQTLIPVAARFTGSEQQPVIGTFKLPINQQPVNWKQGHPPNKELFAKFDAFPILRCTDVDIVAPHKSDHLGHPHWDAAWLERIFSSTQRHRSTSPSPPPSTPFDVVRLASFDFVATAGAPTRSEAQDEEVVEERDDGGDEDEDDDTAATPYNGEVSCSAHIGCPYPPATGSLFCRCHHEMALHAWDLLSEEERHDLINGKHNFEAWQIRKDNCQRDVTFHFDPATKTSLASIRSMCDDYRVWVVDVEFCQPRGV